MSTRPPFVQVFNDVLADPVGYRAKALASTFGDMPGSGGNFKGIAPTPNRELRDWLEANLVDRPRGLITTFLRLSPAGQEEPNYVHTDRDMGAMTGILYLNPTPAPGDGTSFWRHIPSWADMSTTDHPGELARERREWREQVWERIGTVDAQFNRLVLFPSPCFHSRALYDGYGATPDTARLIQVCFLGRPSV